MNAEYLKLVSEVMEIDAKAAKYLLNVAPQIDGFVSSGDLSLCFLWSNTPQGDDYWRDIHTIVESNRGNEKYDKKEGWIAILHRSPSKMPIVLGMFETEYMCSKYLQDNTSYRGYKHTITKISYEF